MKQKSAILLADIYSMFHQNKKPVKRGSKGERVDIIADHGNVLIVIKANRERISVMVSDLLMQ